MSLSNIGIRTSGNFSSTASLLPDDKPSNPDIPDQLNTNPDKLNPHLLNNNLHSIPKPLPDIQRSLATTLQMASAAGDDRSLISHGSDRKYWYSIGDGYRLLLAIRKNNLTYKNEAKTGEEYSAYRENDQHIFITDPYHINNFDNSLEDDIKKITGSHEITALNKKWAHLPKVIIIPVLTGCHWRCLRIKMDYTHRKITILFDDPYGKHRFEKEIKSSLKASISNHVGYLIACIAQQRNDPNFQPSQIVVKEQDK